MNTGLGFSEVLVIVVLILVFFGSKELPQFIKQGARLMAKVRHYSDKVKREFDAVARSVEQPIAQSINTVTSVKDQIRKTVLDKRTSVTPQERTSNSEKIFSHLKTLPHFKNSTAVMIYVSTGSEVCTTEIINEMLENGKRVVVPFCKDNNELGIAEIKDPHNDLVPGKFNIPEPKPELRDNFLKSDLKLVICPGVAFDKFGARLGRGKACYDRFLEELKGRVKLVGVAYDCQIVTDSLPFDYHDVIMDQVITENGLLLPERVAESEIEAPVEEPQNSAQPQLNG